MPIGWLASMPDASSRARSRLTYRSSSPPRLSYSSTSKPPRRLASPSRCPCPAAPTRSSSKVLLLHLLRSPIGTQQPKPRAAVRPQLVGADISPKSANSRFDPERTIGGQLCCDAEQGFFFNDVVACSSSCQREVPNSQ